MDSRRRSASCACSRPTASRASARTRSARPTCASSPPPTATCSIWSKRNQFREDLYYRLNVFTITLPPLRERAEDIVPIAERFLGSSPSATARRRVASPTGARAALGHHWPGNVRELRNVIEQTAVFAQSEVVRADDIQFISTRLPNQRAARAEAREQAATAGTAVRSRRQSRLAPTCRAPASRSAAGDTCSPSVLGAGSSPVAADRLRGTEVARCRRPSRAVHRTAVSTALDVRSSRGPPGGDEHPLVLRIPVGTPLAEAERLLIIKTLEVSDGNKQRAARILGISRRGLYTKLAAYGEHVPAEEAAER